MKKNIVLIIMLLSISMAKAQTATLDSKKILASVPELAKVEDLVMKNKTELQEQLDQKTKTLQDMEIATTSLLKKDPNAAETIQAKEKYQQLFADTNTLQQELSKKQKDYATLLYKPYLEKINNAVKIVATHKKYKQVIDVQNVPLAYTDPAADITEEVIRELKK